MPVSVSTTGDRETAARLRARGARAQRLEPAMRDIARYAEQHVTGVPVDTGRLADSITSGSEQTVTTTDDSFTLATSVPYARYVFHGTRHMDAQPPRVDTHAIAGYAEQRIAQELES